MLKMENVSCGYRNEFVLKDINLDIRQKQITGIIGPNGSGKTTLLRAITKILPLISGSIVFDQRNLKGFSLKELARNIALASNEIEIGYDISVEEFVALGRIPHQSPLQLFENKKDEEAVHQALAMIEMENFRSRPVKNLSAGEQQMVIIAKALAQEPKLLLLDEPVVHLDISHQIYILNLIKRLNKMKNLSVLIVLHELNLAAEYCDKLVLLDKGCLNRIGTPEQVLQEDIIKQVYATDIIIGRNPRSGKPCIFVTADE